MNERQRPLKEAFAALN